MAIKLKNTNQHRIAGLAILLLCTLSAHSQLHLELKDNPKYTKTIEQLWQLKISNLGSNTEHVIISLELNDSANQLIYSGSSRMQEVPSGTRVFNRETCMPISDEQIDVTAFPLKPDIYFFKFKLMDAGTNQMLFSGGFNMDTRAVKSGLAALTQNKIRFGGSASITGQQSDFSGLNTEVPANYTRVMLNPTLTLWEVPVSLSYLYSTENTPNRQPINQFSVQFDPYQYRANLEAKLTEKFESVKDFKNPLDVKKLDNFKSMLKEKPSLALVKASNKIGGKFNLEEIQNKIKDGENIDKILENPDMTLQLNQLNGLNQKYNIKNVEDIDKSDSKVPKNEREKLRKLFALKKQYEDLKNKKSKIDELKKKYQKALLIKQKMDGIDKGDFSTLIKNKVNLKAGLKQFGMMGAGTKILSSIQTFAIGSTYPYFSEQTLNGARVDGFQLEMNPGIFYINIAMGKSAIKAYESTFSHNIYSVDQDLTAIKAGLGKKDATHLFFTGIQIKDANDTSDTAPQKKFTPRENYILGSDLQLSLFKKAILMGGEVNGSIYTTDQNAIPNPADATDKIGANLPYGNELIKKLNSSSKLGYAYKAFTNILLNNTTNITAKFSHIEPSYYSMGNEFLLRDREAIQVNASQALFKNKFTFAGYYEKNNNGLQPFSTLYKTIFTRYGGSIRMNTKVITLLVNYAPYFQSVSSLSDSGSYTNTGEMLTTTFLLKYKFSKKVQLQTQFGNIYQKLTGSTQALVSSYSLMQNINSPALGFQLSASWSPNQNVGGQNKNVLTANLNGTLRILKIWSNTIGYIYYDFEGIELKTGFYYLSQLPITSHMLIDIRVSKNTYSNLLYPSMNFSELYLRYGLKIQF